MEFPPRPTLWLPQQLPQTHQPEDRGTLDFMAVTLSYQQVYNEEASWDRLSDLLAPYSLGHLLDLGDRREDRVPHDLTPLRMVLSCQMPVLVQIKL